MEILRANGVPVETDAVNMMHTNTTEQVLSPGGDIDLIEILAGLLRGETLAPYLFVIASDYAMRQAVWERNQPRIHSQ